MKSFTAIVCISAALGSHSAVHGFLCQARGRGLLPLVETKFSPPLFALVYGADGTVSDEDQVDSSFLGSSPSLSLPPEIVDALSSRLTMPVLSRLGCAFAPPPHANLHPRKVESASLVSIDSTKLEIAVSIPSDGSLAQILVPVPFPTECKSDDDVEATLMKVIDRMDQEACERIED